MRLRHLVSCCSGGGGGGSARTHLRISGQRRWAQVHDVRFLATTQSERSVLEKYRDKLESKARAEGHGGDIESLRAAYKERIKELRKEVDRIVHPLSPAAAVVDGGGRSQQQEGRTQTQTEQIRTQERESTKKTPTTTTTTTESSGSGSGNAKGGIKPLSSILNLPKIQPLPVAELTAIWRLHHAAQPTSLCAVVPADTYAAMDAAARRYPQFLLPVPHPEQGAEMHFLQWTWDAETRSSTVLFTQLAEYKARGEYAAPHTTVTHYTDLAAEKGVVLMRGVVTTDRGVKVDDARWLVMCLQRFYGAWDKEVGRGEGGERAEARRRLLEWFAKGDERFSVERLMDEAERMG